LLLLDQIKPIGQLVSVN